MEDREHTLVKKKIKIGTPGLARVSHLHRGYILINQALRFPNATNSRLNSIQIREKQKTDPCTKNSRNAIRINLFYAEVKSRRWGGGM